MSPCLVNLMALSRIFLKTYVKRTSSTNEKRLPSVSKTIGTVSSEEQSTIVFASANKLLIQICD